MFPYAGRQNLVHNSLGQQLINIQTQPDNWVLIEQLKRWAASDLLPAHRLEVVRLQERVQHIEPELQKVLELVQEYFVGNSIEDVMEMDDAELALQFLLSERKP